MKFQMNALSSAVAAACVVALAACGGGDDGPGASTTLSPNQQQFENQALASNGGSYALHWNLNLVGPQISGTNYVYSSYVTLPASPLTEGSQVETQSALRNPAKTLASIGATPIRVLKDGKVLVVPASNRGAKVTYVGGDVRIDSLASDNATVAYSAIRSNYETVALSGKIGATPADFAHWHNAIFANPSVLNSNATYQAGASYVKFTQTNVGDRYTVFDCNAATTDEHVTACRSGVTLVSALTAGLLSSSDGTTYRLADGNISTIGGVPVWVATAARPQSATLSSSPQYRIYFQLDGNVYTGALTKDGAAVDGSYYVSNPAAASIADRLTFLPFGIRMNKAAHDSIVAAMQI